MRLAILTGLALASLLSSTAMGQSLPLYKWVSTSGTEVQAAFGGRDGDSVVLFLPRAVPFESLSSDSADLANRLTGETTESTDKTTGTSRIGVDELVQITRDVSSWKSSLGSVPEPQWYAKMREIKSSIAKAREKIKSGQSGRPDARSYEFNAAVALSYLDVAVMDTGRKDDSGAAVQFMLACEHLAMAIAAK